MLELEVFNPKIILLDHFESNAERISDLMKLKAIQKYTKSLLTLTVIFAEPESENLLNYIKKIDIDETKKSELLNFIVNSFNASFSHGIDIYEFVFVLLPKNSPLFLEKNKEALTGLVIHEILHSIQRKRGLEDRLRDSYRFNMDLFKNLASLVPKEHFDQEIMIEFLISISQFSIFALKDLYVNYELIKRGFCKPLLKYYQIELGFYDREGISPPNFNIPFEKGKVSIKDLDEFANAYKFMISLIPAWLPFTILDIEDTAYKTSRELKHFIFDYYYTNPAISLMTREMFQLENIYLTAFNFSKSFHIKWFGSIFNIGIEYLLGEDFVFYHLSKVVELLEHIYAKLEDPEREKFAIVPILKAAFVYQSKDSCGIQKENIQELKSLIYKKYMISAEEIGELEEILAEEDTDFTIMFEELIHLAIMIVTKDLREEIVEGDDSLLHVFGRAILTLLQTTFYLEGRFEDEYHSFIRFTLKRLLRVHNQHLRESLALKLEIAARNHILGNDKLQPTIEEAEELIFYYQFFNISITNTTINIGLAFINGIKIVAKKVDIDSEKFIPVVAQFLPTITGGLIDQLSEHERDEINTLLVSSLSATSLIPFEFIQPIVKLFVLTSVGDEEE